MVNNPAIYYKANKKIQKEAIMPTTANSITYFVAADGTLRDGEYGSIAQQPRLNYGTEYSVTLTFPASTIAEGDQLQVAVNRSRTFFSSASATGDAPVAAVAKHDVTAEEAAAQEVTLTLSTNTRAMIDQVNGIDHPVRGFFGVHVLRGQSFVTLAVADALMMSLESGPDAISPSLPVVDYPTREEAEALAERSENAAERAEAAAAGIVPPLQLDAPPTTSTAGSVGQLATWHDSVTDTDHLYHLVYITSSDSATLYHWEECVLVSMGNVAGGYAALNSSAQISVNTIPLNINYGITREGKQLRLTLPTLANINTRSDNNNRKAITPSVLDYAVRSVLPNVTEIPAATSDYSLVDSSATTNNHSHVYSHSPSAVPTYRLPQVTNTTIAHYIELTVDFANVQTYSFLDYQGEPIVPLFTPAIAAGDVYTFKMEYSAIKAAWLIYPQKQGAVADDFVMRGEVGAANGVAGLDANGMVPEAQLNKAVNSSGKYGVVKLGASSNAIGRDGSSNLYVIGANNANIDSRQSSTLPITPSRLNYAVTDALTDANHITLTDAQKAVAQSVFGVGGPITAIPAATTAYTLAEGIFTHAPTNAPTYTLPNITDDIRTHEVVLVIDFSSVQTFSFLVDGGGDVTFQSYANPTKGDVWAFRCWWYGGKWRIAPTQIKNCVTRQLVNGSIAITDAVGGDALALKMTAPRSVVVNQFIPATSTAYWKIYSGAKATLSDVDGALCSTVVSTLSAYTDSAMQVKSAYRYTAYASHKYLVSITIKSSDASVLSFKIETFNGSGVFKTLSAVDTWQTFTYFGETISGTNIIKDMLVYPYVSGQSASEAIPVGLSFYVKNVMVVDLTQYFNGDQTLIDSITSWDDLVAYDPRFASYVEYNTGTVEGVQPTVKVTGKNLFDISSSEVLRTLNVASYTKTTTGVSFVSNASSGNINLYLSVGDAKGFVGKTIRLSCDSYDNGTAASLGYSLYILDSSNWPVQGCPNPGIIPPEYCKDGYHLAIRLYTVGSLGHTLEFKNIQVELGSTATAYEPYHDGGTAQAPAPLFAVGNVADEFEAVTGVTTRKLVEYVVTGSEPYMISSDTYIKSDACDAFFNAPLNILQIDNTISIISNKFVTTTSMWSKTGYPNTVCQNLRQIHINIANSLLGITDYTQETRDTAKAKIIAYLQAQYNAGTPLIVYYPLKTSTTSSTTPAQISLQAGNNTAMQTDGRRLAPIDITYESDEL